MTTTLQKRRNHEFAERVLAAGVIPAERVTVVTFFHALNAHELALLALSHEPKSETRQDRYAAAKKHTNRVYDQALAQEPEK